jgi:hypothetical protein
MIDRETPDPSRFSSVLWRKSVLRLSVGSHITTYCRNCQACTRRVSEAISALNERSAALDLDGTVECLQFGLRGAGLAEHFLVLLTECVLLCYTG